MNPKWIISLFAVFLFTGCLGHVDESNNADDPESPSNITPGNIDPSDPSNPSYPNNPSDPNTPQEQACLSNEDFFMRKVWAQVAQPTCVGCHNSQGLASISNMILNRELGFGDQLGPNMHAMTNMATKGHPDHDNQAHLLLKVSNTLAHGGGPILSPGSREFKILEEFVTRTQKPVDCPTTQQPDIFEGVISLEPQDLFRKATISVAGRIPTQQEMTAIAQGGEPALNDALDSILNEDLFYERLKEGFNDIFLTDNEGGGGFLRQLRPSHYPDALWFEGQPHEQANASKSVYGAGRLPLEIIAHVAKNNLPFTEILTANYIMVNPYSAKSYGVFDQVTFSDPENEHEFQPATLPFPEIADYTPGKPQNPDGYPHAGVLTTYPLLGRYPSTPTNQHRNRAAFFFKNFLAIDILELAPRSNNPLDSIADNQNPTRDAVACALCHVTMDPVAGLFQYHSGPHAFYGHELKKLYKDNFSPGFNGERLPDDRLWEGLRWLGQKTVQDPRFALAMTEHVYYFVTGIRPLLLPTGPDTPHYESRLTSYATQREFLRETTQTFIESGYNIKTAFKTIILSSYFRGIEIDQSLLTPKRTAELTHIGHARPLQPEQLERKIAAVFGPPKNSAPKYFKGALYRFLYGGSGNGSQITERLSEHNAVMAAVAAIVANDVPCRNTLTDFQRPKEQRLLFPDVELTDLPGVNTETDNRIKKNIQYLHDRLLGERLDINNLEIDSTFNLLKNVINDGQTNIKQELEPVHHVKACSSSKTFDDPDYTVRGWMLVISYLMSTYEFLY